MFCGPEVMRRRSEATSSASWRWSYLTSSGPKHFEHTYCAVSSYSAPHSLQARLVTAMGKLLVLRRITVCDEEVVLPAPHVSRNWHLPAVAGVAGVSSGQSLHPSGRVQLCARNHSNRPGGCNHALLRPVRLVAR